MTLDAKFKQHLSARTFGVLWRLNLHTVKAIAEKTEREMLLQPRIGLVTLNEIKAALHACGVTWPTKVEEWK